MPDPTQEVPIGIALGLGPVWTGNGGWAFEKHPGMLHGGGNLHILRIFHGGGILGIGLDAPTLREFARQATTAGTGIEVAPAGLVVPT